MLPNSSSWNPFASRLWRMSFSLVGNWAGTATSVSKVPRGS